MSPTGRSWNSRSTRTRSTYYDEIASLMDTDAIAIFGPTERYGTILTELREVEYAGDIIGTLSASDPSVIAMPPAEGMYLCAPYIYNQGYVYADEFSAQFEETYGVPLSHRGAAIFDAVLMLRGLLEGGEVTQGRPEGTPWRRLSCTPASQASSTTRRAVTTSDTRCSREGGRRGAGVPMVNPARRLFRGSIAAKILALATILILLLVGISMYALEESKEHAQGLDHGGCEARGPQHDGPDRRRDLLEAARTLAGGGRPLPARSGRERPTPSSRRWTIRRSTSPRRTSSGPPLLRTS